MGENKKSQQKTKKSKGEILSQRKKRFSGTDKRYYIDKINFRTKKRYYIDEKY